MAVVVDRASPQRLGLGWLLCIAGQRPLPPPEPDKPPLGLPHHLAPTQLPAALVLEKTHESPLASKEIQPVNAKGNQS